MSKKNRIYYYSLKYYFLLIFLAFSVSALAQTNDYSTGAWGHIDSHVRPWAENVSRPNAISAGLQGRHVSIAASHGRYYVNDKKQWAWQRPQLFCATEDTYTQTVVVPFLIPMLENAGCYVFSPRERDWQTNEIIVDNDTPDSSMGSYMEFGEPADISSAQQVTGFRYHSGNYKEGENPFRAGTARIISTKKGRKAPEVLYVPNISREGHYAVYVAYPEVNDAIDEVTYTVVHKGVATDFKVNQQMGYGTWVYLGSFDFSAGHTTDNMVVVSCRSKQHGHIGLDAVRFGGGMGNIAREGKASGLPRALEAARYSAQWSGADKSIYDSRDTDYNDDIAVRPLMTNWVAGGSPFVPNEKGLRVPLELSLSVHSDAGYSQSGAFTGTLGIATTDFNGGKLDAGISRKTSIDFASLLVKTINSDMKAAFGKWSQRSVWDKNYGETRMPKIPSAIIEMHSHQNFPEMAIAQDPNGKFLLARAIYKSVLKYVADQHRESFVVQPLPPMEFRMVRKGKNKVRLEWTALEDSQEKTAHPTSYNVYVATSGGGFDNGTNVRKQSYTITLKPGIQYDFRITACNAGGESFPTETLSAYIAPQEEAQVLVINGFQRLSAPFSEDTNTTQGFRMDVDEGVQYGKYLGWCGPQKNFDRSKMGKNLGDSSNEWAGRVIAGNEFNYVSEHTDAIASAGRYTVMSCSSTAVEQGLVNLKDYDCIDLLFGLQKDYKYQYRRYKTFTPTLQRQMSKFTERGGRLLVSGAYLGSDMQSAEEKAFAERVLKWSYNPSDATVTDCVEGLGKQFHYHHSLNAEHYAAVHPESLQPVDNAFAAMSYSNGTPAAVAYKDDRTGIFSIGFPFECIKECDTRRTLMNGIMQFLLK